MTTTSTARPLDAAPVADRLRYDDPDVPWSRYSEQSPADWNIEVIRESRAGTGRAIRSVRSKPTNSRTSFS